MADNYLETHYDEYLAKRAKKEAAKKAAWRKRLKEYKEKLKREKNISQASESNQAAD